ncbi:hypothetical protein RB595_010640 [Gaeumannomyces hyphopodioides]
MDRKPLHTTGMPYDDHSGLEVNPYSDEHKQLVENDHSPTSRAPIPASAGGYLPPTTPYPELHSPLALPSTSPPIESDKIISQTAHGYYAGSQQGGDHGGDRQPPGFSYPAHPHEQQRVAGAHGSGSGRKRTAIFIGFAILGLVVAGVVGGIAGWQITEAKNRGMLQTSAGSGRSGGDPVRPENRSGPSTAGVSKILRSGSALAATGFRYGEDYQLGVFYLSPEGAPYYSSFDTAYGSWSTPVKVSEAIPHASTSLAAGINMRNHYDKFVPRFMLYYQGTDSKMASVGFQMPVRRSGEPNPEVMRSLEDFRVGTGASMGAYWPYLIFQDNGTTGSGLVEHNITILGIRDSRQRVSRIMESDTSGPQVAPGSPILALPQSPDVPRDELRVVYRSTEGGRLAVFDRNGKREQVRRHTLPPGFTLGEGAPLAGFATRKGSSTLTTHLVWRGGDGRVMTGKQVGGAAAAWQDPVAEPVFGDAANNTKIACVTAASTSQEGLKETIRESDDMNRCFFQNKDGALVEAWLDGETWKKVGVVHMP